MYRLIALLVFLGIIYFLYAFAINITLATTPQDAYRMEDARAAFFGALEQTPVPIEVPLR